MDLMERRYEQAIATFRDAMQRETGPTARSASALAQAYEQIAFQNLADQVRRSVRSCQGNRWMFRVGGVDEHPLRIHPRLLRARAGRARSSRSWSSGPASGSTSRIADGPTSSSSAWIFPKVRGS